jgi:hypothetical protein
MCTTLFLTLLTPSPQEVYCSWFQLKGGGIETQVPALRAKNKYFTMPLRVQKSYLHPYNPRLNLISVPLRSQPLNPMLYTDFIPYTSIFRHMRLSSGFLNEERTATGIQKLRIPTTLLREKMRTARRFMVCTPPCTRLHYPL